MVEGMVQDRRFRHDLRAARTRRTVDARSAGRMRRRWKRAAGTRPSIPRGPHDADRATQMPHLLRTAIADVLGMPEADLRVVAPDVGGGFGQKMSLAPEYVLLVWLARQLRSSFAWSEDRRENLIAGFHSRDQHPRLDGAFDADGTLLALAADILANIGAFSCFPTTCGVEPLMALGRVAGPLRCPRLCLPARGVATHTCPMAPYRGVSRPVITFALERLMDKAAAAFGIEPGRHPPAQPDRAISLHLRDRPGVRRGHLFADAGSWR